MTSRALDQQEQDWQKMAELDPYWAILTKPGTRVGRWDSNAFFATGPPEVKAVMERAAILGYPRQHHLALDFGCGRGRVTRALTGYFEEVVGLDISETMIRRAQELSGIWRASPSSSTAPPTCAALKAPASTSFTPSSCSSTSPTRTQSGHT